jgi:hypothetical protein
MSVNLHPLCETTFQAAKAIWGALYWALRNAALAVGESVPEPLAVPESERDVPSGEWASFSGPHDVLPYLAELWIISAETDPRVKLLADAMPQLARRRPANPVHCGPLHAKSVTEWLVRAAEHITDSSRNGFGCGPLVKIVQESFPREIPADPWEFHTPSSFGELQGSMGDSRRSLLILLPGGVSGRCPDGQRRPLRRQRRSAQRGQQRLQRRQLGRQHRIAFPAGGGRGPSPARLGMPEALALSG